MIEPALLKALETDRPLSELRAAVRDLLEHGRTREEVRLELEALRAHLSEADREQDEDVVLDVLDFVSGWSSPHMKL